MLGQRATVPQNLRQENRGHRHQSKYQRKSPEHVPIRSFAALCALRRRPEPQRQGSDSQTKNNREQQRFTGGLQLRDGVGGRIRNHQMRGAGCHKNQDRTRENIAQRQG